MSGIGAAQLQESTSSTAGVLSAVAMSWNIADDATAEFVKHLYDALCQPET